jgi:hypothetical protein
LDYNGKSGVTMLEESQVMLDSSRLKGFPKENVQTAFLAVKSKLDGFKTYQTNT